MEPALSEPAAFHQILETEIARWGKVVRDHNIKAD
jgi:hypothetical protein